MGRKGKLAVFESSSISESTIITIILFMLLYCYSLWIVGTMFLSCVIKIENESIE